MAAKLKKTGFARFIIFLLIAAPVIYSGVSLFNGENPIDQAKRDLGIDTTPSRMESNDDQTSSSDNLKSKLYDLKEQNQELNEEIRSLKKELADCQQG